MTKLQSFLERASRELEITIVVPFGLTLRDGVQITAQALLPDLGADKGMIVVNHLDELQGVASELLGLGYGYSVLDEPLTSEEFDLESYVEMFCDWGWGKTNKRKPNWMK